MVYRKRILSVLVLLLSSNGVNAVATSAHSCSREGSAVAQARTFSGVFCRSQAAATYVASQRAKEVSGSNQQTYHALSVLARQSRRSNDSVIGQKLLQSVRPTWCEIASYTIRTTTKCTRSKVGEVIKINTPFDAIGSEHVQVKDRLLIESWFVCGSADVYKTGDSTIEVRY